MLLVTSTSLKNAIGHLDGKTGWPKKDLDDKGRELEGESDNKSLFPGGSAYDSGDSLNDSSSKVRQ